MKKIFGAILFIAGFLVIILNPTFTGNAILEDLLNFRGFVGVILIVSGVILMSSPMTLEKRLVVSSGDRQQIKDAFRQWNGRVTGSQKQILKRYGLKTETTGGNHVAFYFPYADKRAIAASTPGDQRGGLNFALKTLIPYIEENYQENVA